MSTQQDQNVDITIEDLRAARHGGFDDSVAHMDEDRRKRLTDAHTVQDARRENNITGFYSTVFGADA